MRSKVADLAMLTLAIGLCAMPVRADTLVRVTVRGPDGGPAAGVAVTVRQAAGYGRPSGDVEPPAVVGAAATGSDGTVSLHLVGARRYDVYSIAADDRASGRQASTAVFAGDSHWPAPILTLGDPAPAVNLERAAIGAAAASCDRADYAMHVQRLGAAIAQNEASLAAFENALAGYARAGEVAAPTLDAARTQLAAARVQPSGSAMAARVTTLQHYVLLRVLADNLRAGLEADRAGERNLPTLELCSNETKAGVELRARCPPGWQFAQQTAQANAAQSSCRQRSGGTGRERS